MSKKTTKPAATFNVGDRVIAQTAATLQQLATGTIKDVTKSGWFIIELDDTNSSDVLASTKGKVSARQSSLTPMLSQPTASAPASAPATSATGDGTPAPARRRRPRAGRMRRAMPTGARTCRRRGWAATGRRTTRWRWSRGAG